MSLKEKIAGIRKNLQSSGDDNVKAFGTGFIFVAILLISVIAFFLDIVFVTMIWDALPGGFLRIVAAGGAILVSPVILLILLAKLFYFRSGGQLIFSYFAFGIDLIFAGLNTYCAFQIAWGNTDAFVVAWRSLSPITPCVILLLLSMLLILDPNAKRRNKEREYTEKERDLEMQFQYEEKERQFALKQLDAELRAAQQEASIDVKTQALEEYKTLLAEEILGPESRAHLREAARRLREDSLHALTGLPRGTQFPALPTPQQNAFNVMSSEQLSTPVQPVAQKQPQNPLQSPQMTPANQEGSQNGHKN